MKISRCYETHYELSTLNTIHALAIGPEGRVFVLDRSGGEVNLFRATDDPAVFELQRRPGLR